MIKLSDHGDGVVLPVWAQPGARRNGVVGEQDGALKIAVTAPADQGRANKALLEMLRDILGLKRSQLELLTGDKSRRKLVLVRGVARQELERRIGAVLSLSDSSQRQD